jgi:hypothetical protein
MNQIAKLPIQGGRLLPVCETEALKDKVYELEWIEWRVSKLLFKLDHNQFNRLDEAESDLEKLGELPSDTGNTMAMLDQAMQEASVEQIADGLAVLHGLFGSRGEPEIVASTGVELIEAEHVSTIALYRGLIVLLRPSPNEWDEKTNEWKRPPIRKFLPTIPEIIAELQDQRELWRESQSKLKDLSQRHAQARQEITKRIAELRVAVNDARRKTHTIEQAAAQDDGWDIPSEKHHYRK